MFDERRPGDPAIPADLRESLHEWSTYATTVRRGHRPDEVALLSRRGRQLAARVADVLGRPVEFVDPETGAVESIEVGTAAPLLVPEPVGPTPWSTGLPLALFCAVFVAIADIVLSRAFADALGLLWVPANLLIGLGLAPSLWLVRHTPVWRWIGSGATAGLVAAWVVLLLDLLG